MDTEKLERRLCEWSSKLGFTLQDGTFPDPSLFSSLISTPNTRLLWEKILEKVEPRDRVQQIRKQILVAKLKSDEKPEELRDHILNVNNPGIHRKVELWKKKKALEKMIAGKRKEVDQLWNIVYKNAQSIQAEACKLAEIEKNHSDLKEKVLLSNLLLENYKENIEQCKEQINKIKSFEEPSHQVDSFESHKLLERVKNVEKGIIENLEKKNFKMEKNDFNEISELTNNRQSGAKLWDILINIKENNLKEFLSEVGGNDERIENENGKESVEKLNEKFMLDIIENSLQTILNRKLEKMENLKLKQIISDIEKLMFNKSISSASVLDVSYVCPNETGDSLTGRREKMSTFMRVLSFYGLKKRNEFLKREIEKLSRENKKREHWTTEKEKYEDEVLLSSRALEEAKAEATELMTVQKSSVQGVLKSHNELALLVNEVNNDLKERKIFEMLNRFVDYIKNGNERELELVSAMHLDVFRRIQIPPGKDVYAYESLHHCLEHYGGELREFFSAHLVSPYDKPEEIISKLEERKSFLLYIRDTVAKIESDLKNSQNRFAEESGEINLATIDRNYKETLRILSKIVMRSENLEKEFEIAKNILKTWLEQPYRQMIPNSIKINSMTFRQFEEKYRMAESEIQYWMELNKQGGYK